MPLSPLSDGRKKILFYIRDVYQLLINYASFAVVMKIGVLRS